MRDQALIFLGEYSQTMLDRLWLPGAVSTFSPRIDFWFTLIFWITIAAWLLLVTAGVCFFLLGYRSRLGRRASRVEGNPRLELLWTSATAILLLSLAIMSRSTSAGIGDNGPPGDVFYKVTGNQFNWEITYPGPDGKLGTADDFTINNEFHVPVGKVVRIELASRDVIHSFSVPDIQSRRDIVPGRNTNLWFEATRPGMYEVPCAELCGFGHSAMKGVLYVQSQKDYDAWIKQVRLALR